MLGKEFHTYRMLARRNHVNSSCWLCMHVKVQATKMSIHNQKREFRKCSTTFLKLEKPCAGKGTPSRTSKATGSWVLWHCNLDECYVCIGISKWAITRIWREASMTAQNFDHQQSSTKWVHGKHWQDTFDHKAIRRRMYQLYEAKENVTLLKLLVTKHHVNVVKPWNIVGFMIFPPSNKVLA